jgi:hypothetical protein
MKVEEKDIKKEKYKKELLVEGKDDKHVVLSLCQEFDIPKNFDVIDYEGINKLCEGIPVRLKQAKIKTLGIIIDADTDIKDRWMQIRDKFSSKGFEIGNDLPSTGLIKSINGIKIGVWIMPDNNINGMLEDFIAFLVPNNDRLMPIVNATLDDIEGKGLNKYSHSHRTKAAIHSWLAWQKNPGTPMGLSITKRYLTTKNNELCQKFVN